VVPKSNRSWAPGLTITWATQDCTVALVPAINCGDQVMFLSRPVSRLAADYPRRAKRSNREDL